MDKNFKSVFAHTHTHTHVKYGEKKKKQKQKLTRFVNLYVILNVKRLFLYGKFLKDL